MSSTSESNWLNDDQRYVWHPFGALKDDWEVLPVKSGKGAYLYLEDGRALLDGISSWWVNILGHANPVIADAIARQAHTLEQVIFSGFTHQPAVSLAKRLVELWQGSMARAFFSDDGSTSVEVALKMAIQYWHNLGEKRTKIIALEGAYHGDTFGAMAIGDRGPFTTPFHSYLFEVEFIPFPYDGTEKATLEALKNALEGQQAAAFIYEPLVQGAGGMRIYSPEALNQMLALCQQYGALTIADEVMTGFGRTGTLFASQQAHIQPDLVCLSKGITGGFLPLGLTLCNHRVEEAFLSAESRKALYHGHSYTANPIACAAANASLNLLLSEETQTQIKKIGQAHQLFCQKVAGYVALRSVKSCGTILSLELEVPEGGYFSSLRKKLYTYFLSKNILLRPLGNTIYIMPPYIITLEELQSVYTVIEDFLIAEC